MPIELKASIDTARFFNSAFILSFLKTQTQVFPAAAKII
jgi:hypothetical protein